MLFNSFMFPTGAFTCPFILGPLKTLKEVMTSFPYLLSSIVLTAEITETSAVVRPPLSQKPLVQAEIVRRREYFITKNILVNFGSL